MRFMGVIWESVQRPASSGVMRPLGRTEVASIIVREAPRYAKAERCTLTGGRVSHCSILETLDKMRFVLGADT